MMEQKSFILLVLYGLVCLGCEKKLISPMVSGAPSSSTPLSQPQVNLTNLHATNSQETWQQFFEERNAGTIWQHNLQQYNNIEQKPLIIGPPHTEPRSGVINFPTVTLVSSIPNQLEQVTDGILQYLIIHDPNLNQLQLAGGFSSKSIHKITQLSDKIGQFKQLKKLSLIGNSMEALPSTISQLTGLQKLNLHGNPITTWPTELNLLTSLTKLNLGEAKLRKIPSDIDRLKALTKLNLFDNQLTEIPAALNQCTQLKTIYLGNNQFTEFPLSVCSITTLKKLCLDYNQIDHLPKDLSQLVNLQELDLSNNQLAGFLPSFISTLKQLEILHLNDNKLVGFMPPSIGTLTQLKTLDLSNNQLIGFIPPAMSNLTQLNELNISRNKQLFPLLPASLYNPLIAAAKEDSDLGLDIASTRPFNWLEIEKLPAIKVTISSHGTSLNGSADEEIHTNPLKKEESDSDEEIIEVHEEELVQKLANETNDLLSVQIHRPYDLITICLLNIQKYLSQADGETQKNILQTIEDSVPESFHFPNLAFTTFQKYHAIPNKLVIYEGYGIKIGGMATAFFYWDKPFNHVENIQFMFNETKNHQKNYLEENDMEQLPLFLWLVPYSWLQEQAKLPEQISYS